MINIFHFSLFVLLPITFSLKEYISVDEIPLQETPLRRSKHFSSDDELKWLEPALKSIAYYLRQHKFNEYDRRYILDRTKAEFNYFHSFPKPPLRSLHWEVHKHCEPSFLSCVEYLKNKIKNTGLKREDDTSIVIHEQEWNKVNNSEQISTVEAECRKLKKIDKERADPFEGPIERFQWRTTASYYMCWYTMNEVPNLIKLNENCYNFANCLDPNFGSDNKDPRGDDNVPFRCALYSFCPDPCCARKHTKNLNECWEEDTNPCLKSNPPDHRECTLNRTQNTDFNDIVLNHWNVTCHCPERGFIWDSRYGMCIDIDECLNESHSCDVESESCINLPGSYECVCRWGYSKKNEVCKPSRALSIIKMHRIKAANTSETKKASSIVKKLFTLLFTHSQGNVYKLPLQLLFLSISLSFSN